MSQWNDAEGTALLRAACRELALRDPDRARDQNAVGFNQADGWLGHALANTPEDQWTAEMRYEAWNLLRKYRVQLSRYGVDYDAIPQPPKVGDRQAARDHAWSARKGRDRSLSVDGGEFVIKITYDDKDALKDALQVRRWDPNTKTWRAPVDEAARLAGFIAPLSFSVSEEAQALLDQVEPVRVQPVAAPREGVEVADTPRGRQFLIRFPYGSDNFQAKLDAVKRIGSRWWNKEDKVWEVAAGDGDKVLAFAGEFGIALTDEAVAEAGNAAKRREERIRKSSPITGPTHFDDLDMDVMEFQGGTIEAAIEFVNAIIGHDMGLGKTVCALGVVAKTKSYPALAVVPAPLKDKWAKIEIAIKWLRSADLNVFVASGEKPQPIPADVDVVIINYDILSKWEKTLERVPFKMLICDESHRLANPTAQRSKAILRHVKPASGGKKVAMGLVVGIRARKGRVILLSGTAAKNRPLELVHQLDIADMLKHFGGAWKFKMRYCGAFHNGYGWDFTGHSNDEELFTKLREVGFIRVTKAEVLTDLPPKRRVQVPVPLDPTIMREYRKAESDIVEFLMERAEAIAEETGQDPRSAAVLAKVKAEAAQHLVEFNALRGIVGRAKVKALIDFLSDFDGKVIVGAHHRPVIEEIAAALESPFLYGGMASKALTIADDFQTNENTRRLVLGMTAAGEGLDLTAAEDVVFAEFGWNPGTHDQVEDRAYGRLNDPHPITAWYLIGEGTVDEDLWDINNEKRDVLSVIFDGKQPEEVVAGAVAGEIAARLLQRAQERQGVAA